MAVPNQKTITINKYPIDYHVDNWMECHSKAIDYAMLDLKTLGSVKLYIYLAKNSDGAEWELSRTAFCNWSGLSREAYLAAVKDLIAKKYLIPDEEGDSKNPHLQFYDWPSKREDYIEDFIITPPK